MIDAQIEALLDSHYQAIRSGQLFTLTPEKFGIAGNQTKDAHELLFLADRLSSILTPVVPTAEFETQLRDELVGTATPPLILRWRKLPAGTRLAARLGGITLTAGLALLASRRVFSLLGALNGSRVKSPKVVTLPANPLS